MYKTRPSQANVQRHHVCLSFSFLSYKKLSRSSSHLSAVSPRLNTHRLSRKKHPKQTITFGECDNVFPKVHLSSSSCFAPRASSALNPNPYAERHTTSLRVPVTSGCCCCCCRCFQPSRKRAGPEEDDEDDDAWR